MLADIVERLSNWKHASFRRDGSTLETMNEAADEITTLRARVKELESGGWISVEDRLPDCDEFLGGNFRGSPWMAVCWKFKVHNQNGDYYKYTGGEVVTKNNITHWQPLPNPPKD